MRMWLPILAVVLAAAPARPSPAPTDAAALTTLLNEFLAGASRNDVAVHDRFWSENLVYTSSSGRRMGKADIMKDLRAPASPSPGAPPTTYTAEDVRIQQYGDTAVVAFRLVGTTMRDGKSEVGRYLNTGTFRKRSGKWQAVGWQATRMPRPPERAREGVAAAEAELRRALLAGDAQALASLLDETFVWTDGAGERHTRPQLLADPSWGRLRYPRLETSEAEVSVYRDAAVVRGTSGTLTFIDLGEGWRAVAMHSNRLPEP